MNRNLLHLALAALVFGVCAAPARAYVEIPYSLARVIAESNFILTVQVEKVDKEKNLILYRKVADLKGTFPQTVIRHNIGRAGFHPREWQNIMAWAEPGKIAVFFHNGGASEMCIANYWYQAYAGGEWWNMSHAEPFFLRSFAGNPEKLATIITQMLAGQDAIVPCMVDGDKNALQLRTARIQRLRANMKLMDYNAQRDFVGWGGDDLRAIQGMKSFSHFAGVGRLDPEARGVATADIDGDGKPEVLLYGEGKVSLYQLSGSSLNEISLPHQGGARSAEFADFNGDGKPDLLLATAKGPRLYTNDKGKGFRDETGGLPASAFGSTSAAAWIDYNGDKLPDIVVATAFNGLQVYRNLGPDAVPKTLEPKIGKWFYAGPFDNTGMRGFDAVYPPEQGVDLTAKYAGKANRQVDWKEGKFTDGQVNSLSILPDNNDVAIYLYREFDFGGPAEIPCSFGSDDTLTVWLNGQKLIAENQYRGAAPDQNQATLRLRPGKNELLLKICQGSGDFAFYFAMKTKPTPTPPLFADATAEAKLGPNGLFGNVRGDHLAVADVNGDGRQDVLFSAGAGLLALNTPQGFVAAPANVPYQAGRVVPVFADLDGDKIADLIVPQIGAATKVFKGDGKGSFADVTGSTGDLAKLAGRVTCVTPFDFDKDGKLDLLVGCMNGPNRYFRNAGGTNFVEASETLGFDQRIFNTRGLAAVDMNGDGAPDLVLSNEGQDSALLLGKPRTDTQVGLNR